MATQPKKLTEGARLKRRLLAEWGCTWKPTYPSSGRRADAGVAFWLLYTPCRPAPPCKGAMPMLRLPLGVCITDPPGVGCCCCDRLAVWAALGAGLAAGPARRWGVGRRRRCTSGQPVGELRRYRLLGCDMQGRVLSSAGCQGAPREVANSKRRARCWERPPSSCRSQHPAYCQRQNTHPCCRWAAVRCPPCWAGTPLQLSRSERDLGPLRSSRRRLPKRQQPQRCMLC